MKSLFGAAFSLWLCSGFMVGAAGVAYGEQHPAKVVRVIVPFTSGGGGNSTARPVAAKLTEFLGQQFEMVHARS